MVYQQNTVQQKYVIARSKSEPVPAKAGKAIQNNGLPPPHQARGRNDKNEEPDRHTPLLKWANELNKTNISENKTNRQKQWTPEKRARQAAIINDNKPWLKSTGAKTAKGKHHSSQNALKHGGYSAAFAKLKAALKAQADYCRQINAQTGETIRLIHDIHAKTRAMSQPSLITLTKETQAALKQAGIDISSHEVKRMVRQATGLTESDYISTPDKILLPEQIDRLWHIVNRRIKGEPLTRIVGETEFWGLPFTVTPDVLDPRPDTETLVEAVLKYCRNKNMSSFGLTEGSIHSPKDPSIKSKDDNSKALKILDLGTGTGCIPIALLTEIPHATAYAVEYSAAAAQIARENAVRNNVSDRFHIIQGDWMAALKPQSFDIITSNPPYIIESDIPHLMPEVKNHDPIMALSGGKDGLECYKKIILHLEIHMKTDAIAFLEIGVGQCESLTRLLEDSTLMLCDSVADIAGIPRVLEIRRKDWNGDK